MQQPQTDIVQSFWLRFWREPHQGQHHEWRGSIWHEQQAKNEKPTAVANPEDAFELVRRALRASCDAGTDAAADGIQSAAIATVSAAPRGWLRRVLDSGLALIRGGKREPKP